MERAISLTTKHMIDSNNYLHCDTI
jgi:hypothetical protein